MRVAYVGLDLFAACALAVEAAGHTVTHLFSARRHFDLPLPVRIADVARELGLKVEFAPVTQADLDRLVDSGVELLVCAGYPHRIPVVPDGPLRAVNIHPSLLPEGRGPWPLPWIILKGLPETGVTIHELTPNFDAGPILFQARMPVLPDDSTESLILRTCPVAENALRETLRDFEAYWLARRPQGPGSYWRRPGEADRTVDWGAGADQIARVFRAFGHTGVYVRVGGRKLTVFRGEVWRQLHDFAPGQIVARRGTSALVAASDGYVYLPYVPPRWRRAAGGLAWRARRQLRRLGRG